MRSILIKIQIFICLPLFLNAQADGQSVAFKEIFDAKRIEPITYKLVLYNQNGKALSNIALLNRQITREVYQQKQSIRILETYTSETNSSENLSYIDAETLMPLYLESKSGDTLTTKYTFKKDIVSISEIKNGRETKKDVSNPKDVFISNSFSELVQSIDFAKHKAVNFKTFKPGKEPGTFQAERISESEFKLPNKTTISTWIIKFTLTRSSGETKPAGYRYVDKKTGKVLAFKSDIHGDSFFTYQMNLLENAL